MTSQTIKFIVAGMKRDRRGSMRRTESTQEPDNG